MLRIQRIVWAAMAFSTVLYAAILLMLPANRSAVSFDHHFENRFIVILYALVVVQFLVATAFSFVLRNRPQQLRMIITLALYEACAIYGVIAAFINHDWRLYVAPWVIALLGFVRVFPSAEPTLTP